MSALTEGDSVAEVVRLERSLAIADRCIKAHLNCVRNSRERRESQRAYREDVAARRPNFLLRRDHFSDSPSDE